MLWRSGIQPTLQFGRAKIKIVGTLLSFVGPSELHENYWLLSYKHRIP
jgi:hypothetical protein